MSFNHGGNCSHYWADIGSVFPSQINPPLTLMGDSFAVETQARVLHTVYGMQSAMVLGGGG